ncbi:MAG: AAA-like domain-containing protein [Lachnospiraceae bacterium]|nr:AAA-like domain-containing protein [Lachnospiraceae bacterium]
MGKYFNVTAVCIPDRHYMVDITERLRQIKEMVDRGDYFTINRARQYGKTTTLTALEKYLQPDYLVISLDFQGLETDDFTDNQSFARALSREIYLSVRSMKGIPEDIPARLKEYGLGKRRDMGLPELFLLLNEWCERSEKPLVLMIDETDAASNNQVFLDFLAQLRLAYIKRDKSGFAAFRSVILAGVYNIRNLKRKFVEDGEHQTNSPWNIAADFLVDMSFSPKDIAGMLLEYENDYTVGMDIHAIAQVIFDYTSGYPFLVSRICKLLDEQIAGTDRFPDKAAAWTREGVLEAVRRILLEKNTLFESLKDKIDRYPNLKRVLYRLLMNGETIPYDPDDESVDIAMMFGFVKATDDGVQIANRIFETRLYNLFLSNDRENGDEIYKMGDRDKPRFIENGILNMEKILERFAVSFNDLYGDQSQKFVEEDGRRFFLLYLRPIINGTGNYYIESRTRNQERTDVIVDYGGKQYVIELKIWRGNSYNTRGEKQLSKYLEHYHLKKGYMLSFNFNKKKEPGIHKICFGDKILVEAVV